MTVVLERATLTGMEDEVRQDLAAAADAYEQAPANLRATILKYGRLGERPADIVKAIRHVYTYDYVARLIREDKAKQREASAD